MTLADHYHRCFVQSMDEAENLMREYVQGKAAAARGKLRDRQTELDLVTAWKQSHRARKLRGDIEEAHRNAQTYALAVLVERSEK